MASLSFTSDDAPARTHRHQHRCAKSSSRWKATLKIKCAHCGEIHQIVRETYIDGVLKDATGWSWAI